MCRLVIEQERYYKVEFEFLSPVDAAIMVDSLKPYASVDTKFIITDEVKEEIPEEKEK